MPSTPEIVAINLPYAGLGNRLRFTLSVKHVASALGREFSYVWPVGGEFGARFDELWRVPAGREFEATGTVESSFNAGDWNLDQPRVVVRGSSAVSGFAERDSWHESLRALTPSPAVQALIDGCDERLAGASYVGVQVRSSPKTHQKTLDHSPVEWFERRMAEMVEIDASTRFFVSADEPAVADRLTSRFPSVAIPKTGAYNSYEALVESAADLHVLSRASHLLAPYWSSFAQTAWLMGGKSQPLEDSVRTVPAQ